MELELEVPSNVTYVSCGNVEVQLPSYVSMLPSKELEEARCSNNREKLVIAAGRVPGTDVVLLCNGDGLLMDLITTGVSNPRVYPTMGGKGVVIGSIVVSSTTLISASLR